jgi:hypothetical protein
MTTRAVLIAFACAVAIPVAHADTKEQQHEQKFCTALAQFHSDLASLEGIGPNSTLAELRAASDRVSNDADKVQKSAKKIKGETSKQFQDSANTLRKEVRALPENITVAQAKSRIGDDVKNVKEAAKKLAEESGCPMESKEQNAPEQKSMEPQSTPPEPTQPQATPPQ